MSRSYKNTPHTTKKTQQNKTKTQLNSQKPRAFLFLYFTHDFIVWKCFVSLITDNVVYAYCKRAYSIPEKVALILILHLTALPNTS